MVLRQGKASGKVNEGNSWLKNGASGRDSGTKINKGRG